MKHASWSTLTHGPQSMKAALRVMVAHGTTSRLWQMLSGISGHVVGRTVQLIYKKIKVMTWAHSCPSDLTTVAEF